MNEKNFLLKRDGDIGLLEINNPPENYLSKPDFIDLNDLGEFVSSGIKALVVSGTGRHFSAGADLDLMKKQITDQNKFYEKLKDGNRLLSFIDELEIPVIAAISGVCFGAGLEIALACNIRYSHDKAQFAFPEVNQNVMPGLGGIARLQKIAGTHVTLELVLKGDLINAKKAFAIKIVDQLTTSKEVVQVAVNKAKSMTNDRPLYVIQAVMKSIRNHQKLDASEAISEDCEMFTKLALAAFGKGNKVK